MSQGCKNDWRNTMMQKFCTVSICVDLISTFALQFFRVMHLSEEVNYELSRHYVLQLGDPFALQYIMYIIGGKLKDS